MQKTSNAGLEFIERAEGFSPAAYPDAGGFSIGFGTFITPALAYLKDKVITKEEARVLMMFKVNAIEAQLSKVIKTPLTQSQFDALVSFSYNLGTGWLTKSGLITQLALAHYEYAGNEMLRWNKSGGKTLLPLIARRVEERSRFLGYHQPA